MRVMNEPTAACISYGLDKSGQDNEEENLLILDVGSHSFDITIATVEDGIFDIQVKAGD